MHGRPGVATGHSKLSVVVATPAPQRTVRLDRAGGLQTGGHGRPVVVCPDLPQALLPHARGQQDGNHERGNHDARMSGHSTFEVHVSWCPNEAHAHRLAGLRVRPHEECREAPLLHPAVLAARVPSGVREAAFRRLYHFPRPTYWFTAGEPCRWGSRRTDPLCWIAVTGHRKTPTAARFDHALIEPVSVEALPLVYVFGRTSQCRTTAPACSPSLRSLLYVY
jgi:hypothetical protein